MKVYKTMWSFKGEVYQWHQNNCYKDAGIFSSKELAEKVKKEISDLKYPDGRVRYDVSIEEIELDVVSDKFMSNILNESKGE